MKVCTDSCLFGAWVSLPENGRVVDIGAGTGLLSLMAAQRTNALVDAVELQLEAALEARVNVSESPWADRINVYQGNILDATLPVYQNLYDAVICNPPFYDNHLKPNDPADATARHNATLPLNGLLNAIEKLLLPTGSAFLLLPYEPFKDPNAIFTNSKLKLAQSVAVKNHASKQPIRWMLELKHETSETTTDGIVIYNDDKSYTDRFTELLRPFYLYL